MQPDRAAPPPTAEPCHPVDKRRTADGYEIECRCGEVIAAGSGAAAKALFGDHQREAVSAWREWHRQFVGAPDRSRFRPEVP